MNLFSLKKITFALCVVASVASTSAYSSELKYQPINPGFGGNPFNNSYLQGTAESQKQFNAPARQRTATDPLADFSNTVTRSLISRLSQDITESIFGENAQDSGQFVVGDLTLDFQKEGDLVNIVIQDASSGGETTIALPVPQF